MSYHYLPGTVRWKRLTSGDPRGYRPNKGWEACAMVSDYHAITDRRLKQGQWWIREKYKGD
jgi:hypothetical protein